MYLVNIVFLLQVSTNLAATLSEEHYNRWLYRDMTGFCVPMHRCKIQS